MSRPVGRHRARRDTGIQALRRPAVAATAAISSISVGAAAYATAATANASVAGAARANIAAGAASAAFDAANSGVALDGQAQAAAANRAVSARTNADAAARAAAAARATAAAKLQGKAAASVKAAQQAAAAKQKADKAAASNRASTPDTSRDSSRPPAYSGSPQAIASAMLPAYGWGQDQMGCLVSLWNRESGWNVGATNPSSGAYGIPQSLPGSKMASAGADWRTNPATQIRWGLGYIKSTYGSPCGAWGHSQATGWY